MARRHSITRSTKAIFNQFNSSSKAPNSIQEIRTEQWYFTKHAPKLIHSTCAGRKAKRPDGNRTWSGGLNPGFQVSTSYTPLITAIAMAWFSCLPTLRGWKCNWTWNWGHTAREIKAITITLITILIALSRVIGLSISISHKGSWSGSVNHQEGHMTPMYPYPNFQMPVFQWVEHLNQASLYTCILNPSQNAAAPNEYSESSDGLFLLVACRILFLYIIQ